MDVNKAINIITLLAEGINPYNSEKLPINSPYQNPDTIRALYVAIRGLKRLEEEERKMASMPKNFGKKWDSDEEKQVLEFFDNGIDLKEIARMLERTSGAIRSKLIEFGRIDKNEYQ